jgi:hypothetical protein
MSHRNEVFQAIPFEASYDVNEPLIAAGDAEEEDRRLQEKVVSRFKFSSLLLGLLVGFFCHFFSLGGRFLVITVWGEDAAIKTKTDIFISLLCSLFFLVIAIGFLFLLNWVAITYSAIGGRSRDLPEEMVLHIECRFAVGVLVGISLAWTMTAVHVATRTHTDYYLAVRLGLRAQTVYSLVALLVGAFFWYKIKMMYFSTNIKPSLSRRSMMAV